MEQLLTVFIGAISGFIAALWQGWFDRRNQLDQSLMEQRRSLYAEVYGS